MRLNIQQLRGNGASDQAIVDLLELQQLGLAPGHASVDDLRELWHCHQSTVSRRMAAIAQLNVCTVRSTWGGYTISPELPAEARVQCPRHDRAVAAMRWEALRQRWREVAA